MRSVAVVAGLVYLAALLALTLLPLNEDSTTEIAVRLTPFGTLGRALRLGPGSYEYGVMILNMLAFVPVGLLVPVLTRTRSVLLAVGAGLILSVLIEIAQFTISLIVGYSYRRADIDDVIANTVGALLGFTIFFVADAVASRLREAGR
jgi:glycopeptide antibiotics resistance protein